MLEPGDIVDGRFEVEGLLGEGGLAQVFRVRHTGLGSLHALKLLTWRKKSLNERLLVEGRIQAQLHHPNIVAVTDLVHHDGQLGLLMEFVDHESLEEYIEAHGGLGVERGLQLFAPILSAVTAAHDAGVTHRDLKPANILLSSVGGGLQPKVTDFGIAKVVQEMSTGSGTAVGATMGTPGYLAPEQVEDSSKIDARADIFALGAICWELITGVRAFADQDGLLTVASTLQNTPVPASTWVDDVPAHVDAALAKAMSKDADARFADCRSFARELFRDSPLLIGLVEGQAVTGTLSLENLSNVVPPRTLSGRTSDLHSQPTLLSHPGTEDSVVMPARGGRNAMVFALVVLGFGLAGAAGLVTAVTAFDMMKEAPVDPDSIPAVPAGEMRYPVGSMPDEDGPASEEPSTIAGPVPVAAPVPEPAATQNDEAGSVAVDAPAPEPEPTPQPLPEPVAQPEPAAQPEPDDAPVPEIPPDPVAPHPVPETAPEPTVAPVAPEPQTEPHPVAAAVPPAPEPEPVAPDLTYPNVAGSWRGKANARPIQLQLERDGAAVSGRVIFPGPSTREESLRGTVTSGGTIEFSAADLVFVGSVNGGSMTGTYRRGGGKSLKWSVQSK